MSLIVARVVGQEIYILGDTALTYRKVASNGLIEGCLKQYRIGDRLAVAFAGEAADFESICEKILGCHDTPGIVEIALRHVPKASDLELLICEIGREDITFIKRGIVTTAASGFIGDAPAYGKFQSAFHNPQPPEYWTTSGQLQMLRIPEPINDSRLYERLFDALRRVVEDVSIPSVGGMIVPLCTDKGVFRFINYAGSSIFRREAFGEGWQPTDFGTTELGGYSYDFGTDEPRGGKGDEIGFYLLQAGFGVIFPANAAGFRRADIVKAESPPIWVLNTSKRLGSGIASTFDSPQHCGIAGERFLEAGNFDDAIFCYQLGDLNRLIEEQPGLADRYVAGHAAALASLHRPQEAIALLDIEIKRTPSANRCRQLSEEIKQHFGNVL